MPRESFAILGAGAIGSILGAHLARAGHPVTLLARGRRAAVLERDGLRIRGLANFAVPVTVLREPSRLRPCDALIVAMKTPGTAEALTALSRDAIGVAFSIQNGLAKNDILAAALGENRVLGALADTSGELLADGAVLFTRNINVLLGERTGTAGARATGLAAALDAAGIVRKRPPTCRRWNGPNFAPGPV